jgi:signal transduction histidine kinase
MWEKLVQIVGSLITKGFKPSLSEIDKNRIITLNIVCFFGTAIYSLFTLYYFLLGIPGVWIPNLLGVGITLFIFIFHVFKLTRVARVYATLAIPTYLMGTAIVWGQAAGIEYYIIFASLLCIFLFNRLGIIILIFSYNMSCFFAAKLSFLFMRPVWIHPFAEVTFYINITAVFLLILIFLANFKERFETLIIQTTASNRKLASLNKKLEESEKELKELNHTKNKFFSIITHDLKNPFSIVSSLANLLADKYQELDDSYRHTIALTIKNSIASCNDLIENLFLWSKSQYIDKTATKIKINLNEEIPKIMNLLKPMADLRKISLSLSAPADCFMVIDENALRTILRNLIINAIKFSLPGGIVNIRVQKKEQNVIILVSDTGIGMAENEIDKLFRIDVDVASIGTSDQKGTGLGLILCKEFVHACDGHISVTSIPNQGSTFKIVFPTNL